MTIYEKYFEDPFIKDSEKYFTQKSAGWLASLNCPEYLKEADTYLINEETRADENFDPQTRVKILAEA
jgi:lipid II:glycine glycyltransferase (peptidoglycan interpeptide bridge formation enzyme)